ncbi:hypothetical protein GCM10009555_015330 [Acrocarpospora macrocephala]|uniref:SnoaL-like domain-containing protein n=1 Tax=Acrocarpospora macrocephala TaxID=150177 RepID=A0A5M3WYY2_9ACTN|nr:nuclear transport factor 2 family protein [Acrocarpospora macrocephala]GES14174.1 hypothetical protein Amac_077710 [Acrocarpospora macrocephala]
MDPREAAGRFARTWQIGWTTHDTALLAALYADTCVHRSMPFRPVHQGKTELTEYLAWSFASEEIVQVRFGEPLVDGRTAAVEFLVHANEDGQPVTLAGCVFVTFDDEGLVTESRDYWHTTEGHVELTRTR